MLFRALATTTIQLMELKQLRVKGRNLPRLNMPTSSPRRSLLGHSTLAVRVYTLLRKSTQTWLGQSTMPYDRGATDSHL